MKKREKIGNGSSLVSFQNVLKENKNLTPNFQPGVTVLSKEEVARHNTRNDCWTIYKGHVYNVTPFLEYHPGDEDELMKGAGNDCTLLYDKIHPWVNADAVLGPLRLGVLRVDPGTPKSAISQKQSRLPSPGSIPEEPKSPSMSKMASPESMPMAVLSTNTAQGSIWSAVKSAVSRVVSPSTRIEQPSSSKPVSPILHAPADVSSKPVSPSVVSRAVMASKPVSPTVHAPADVSFKPVSPAPAAASSKPESPAVRISKPASPTVQATVVSRPESPVVHGSVSKPASPGVQAVAASKPVSPVIPGSVWKPVSPAVQTAASKPVSPAVNAPASASSKLVSPAVHGSVSKPAPTGSQTAAASKPVSPAVHGSASKPASPAVQTAAASKPVSPAVYAQALSKPISPAVHGHVSKPVSPAMHGSVSKPVSPGAQLVSPNRPKSPSFMQVRLPALPGSVSPSKAIVPEPSSPSKLFSIPASPIVPVRLAVNESPIVTKPSVSAKPEEAPKSFTAPNVPTLKLPTRAQSPPPVATRITKRKIEIITSNPVSPRKSGLTMRLMNQPIGIFRAYFSICYK